MENNITEDYPLGGNLETYDIWREKQMMDSFKENMDEEDEEDLDEIEEESDDDDDDTFNDDEL